MTTISLLTILCQSASIDELETTARELGCMDVHERYGALHMLLPDGTRGSFRRQHDPIKLQRGPDFVWCAADSAE